MTKFAPHRDTLKSFVDCINGGADEDTLTRLLAEVIGMQPWELRTTINHRSEMDIS